MQKILHRYDAIMNLIHLKMKSSYSRLVEKQLEPWFEEELNMSDAILLVDDEPSVLSAICRSLRGEPYEVVSELSGEMALERMEKQAFIGCRIR